MPVGVGVVAGRDVVVVLAPDQRGHRGGRGAVHPDLLVPVERHEPPGRVDQRVDHGQVEAVPLGDLAPVVHARAAQRVGADPHAGLADRVEVEHVRQVVDVGRRGSRTATRPRGPAANGMRRTSPSPPAISSLARAAITEVASVSAGPPCGGLYLKPPSAGGLCDGRDHDAVGEPGPGRAAAVGAQDRVGDRRRRRVAVAVVDQHRHVVGGQHLQRRRPRRLGEAVGVAAEEQRAVVALLAAVVADRLRGGEDVGLVERRAQAAAAVPAGAERDLLVDVVGVGHPGVVGRDQVGDVDEVGGLRRGVLRASRSWGHHAPSPPRRAALVSVARPPASG